MKLISKKVLVIAPHPDDETLAMGGSIAKFIEDKCEVHLLIVSGHLPPVYKKEDYEITVNEAKQAFEILGVHSYSFLEIPATTIGSIPVHELNSKILNSINELRPEVVFCPYPDRHIDHRLIFDSSMVACRPVRNGKNIEILATYETLSETHWNAPHIEPNFTPNWIIDITNFFHIKANALSCYSSQISDFPGPRSIEAVEALAKFRGTQSGFSFGEGFQIIRKVS
jgi:LmbE family N-acetylglucosaminyl deacetylase